MNKLTVKITDTTMISFSKKDDTNKALVEMVREKGKIETFVETPAGQVALQLETCGNPFMAKVRNWKDMEALYGKYEGQTLPVSLVAKG